MANAKVGCHASMTGIYLRMKHTFLLYSTIQHKSKRHGCRKDISYVPMKAHNLSNLTNQKPASQLTTNENSA